MRSRGGGVGHRVLVNTECRAHEIEEEELDQELEEGYGSNEEDLEDEILHYGYDYGPEDDEEEDNNDERGIAGVYGGERGLEQIIEEEEEMRANLGPEDREAEDDHDGYYGYAPFN